MNKNDIEIPFEGQRGGRYRFFEILPGAITWSILILPFVISIFNPRITVAFIIGYLLLWFIKSIGLNIRALQGYKLMQEHQKLDWQQLLKEVEAGEVIDVQIRRPKWHFANLERLQANPTPFKPSQLIHAVIIATYNERREVLEPTIQSVLSSDYDMRDVILVIAYEGRDGAQSEKTSLELIEEYGGRFKHAIAVKHPMTEGEVRGKGGNITYAGRKLEAYLETQKIDPLRVIVTTLDADNRPHSKYLTALSYIYAVSPDPLHKSFQPIPMYTNNIWDAPAPMRVIATGNSFWNIILSLRPHMLRNFSSHAQSMAALIDTDYWSVRTIVEDGHQFWRTYFRYYGNHEVYPIYVPIYQDAVLAEGYRRTLKAQFIQIRRWAWGCSDIAFVFTKAYLTPNKVPAWDKLAKLARLIESHLSWATAPIIIAFAAFVPILFNPDDIASNQLPIVVSSIQRVAMVGLVITMYLSFKSLPPKPLRYKRRHSLLMVLQWVLLPITSILYNATAALYSQTRLFLGKYLDKFDVTEKAVKK